MQIGILLGMALCGAGPAALVAQQQESSPDQDVERLVREGMVEALHAHFHGGRTAEELRLLALAQTNKAARVRDEQRRQEAFKDAEARYLAWVAVVEQDRKTERVQRLVNATMARVTCASMILSQWAATDLDEFEITAGKRSNTKRLLDLLLKTREFLDRAAETLRPLVDELLDADRQRDGKAEEQYLIAGIYDTIPQLQLDVRFNRAWTNLYIAMVAAKDVSQRVEALRAAERDFLELVDSDQSGETAGRCRLGLAMTLREQGRYEEARRHFEVALQGADNVALAAQIRYELARGEIRHGRFEEARVVLRSLSEKDPEALAPADQPARFHINLAHLWEANSHLEEALLLEQAADKSAARQAVRTRAAQARETGLRKMNRLASRGGSWPALVQLFVSDTIDSAADEKTQSAAELLFAARQLMEEKEYSRALTQLQAAARRENVPPDLAAEILYELGVCHYRREQTRAAAEMFARVAREHRSHAKSDRAVTYAYQLWARLAEQSKRREDYLCLADVLLNLVQSYPEHEQRAEAMWWLPVALQAGRRYREASEHFGNVPADSPQYEEAQYRRVLCKRLSFESSRDSLSPAELRAPALTVAKELIEYAERAYQRVDTNGDPPARRARSAEALVSAAEVYVSEGVGRSQQGLDLLADFEQRYEDRAQIGRVLAVRISAHRALHEYDQAAQVVELFLRTVPPEQAGGTLAVVARGMQEEVERLEGEGEVEAARRVADQSIPTFEELEKWVLAESSRAKYLDAVRYGLARMCYVAGQYGPARELTARLLAEDDRNGDYQRLNALVLTAIATEQPAPPRLARAREAWGVMLRDPLLRTAAPQRYWEARYHYLEIMLREGKAAEVENAIRQDRVWYPDRGETEWDQKLDELYERAVAELGDK